MDIYDVLGRQVITLIDRSFPAGMHSFIWQGSDQSGQVVASGIYFCKLNFDHQVITRKLSLVK